MSKPHTYADAITDIKEWIAYEVESNSNALEKSHERCTRILIRGRLDELHAMHCYRLIDWMNHEQIYAHLDCS